MKNWIGAALVASLAFAQSDRASAQDDGKVSIGFADYVEPAPDEPRWVVCYSVDFGAKKNYVGSIIATNYRDTMDSNGNIRWREKLKEQFNLDKTLYGGCNIEKTAADANWRYGVFTEFHPSHPKELILVDWQMKPPAAKAGSKSAGKPSRPAKTGATPVPSKAELAPPKYVEVTDSDGKTIRLSPEVAARNKAAAEEYRRKVEAQQRATADHDRKLAENVVLARENAAKTAAAKQAHDLQLAASAAEAAAHKAAMDDYNKKLAGASTNDDPNRCITSPEIKPGLRGNTEVRITNGCDQKVDIVICLKRTTGDWLCGANFGILSQRSMTFMSTNATGEIYVDAVTFGSKNKLGRPAGIIK